MKTIGELAHKVAVEMNPHKLDHDYVEKKFIQLIKLNMTIELIEVDCKKYRSFFLLRLIALSYKLEKKLLLRRLKKQNIIFPYYEISIK